VLHERAIDMHPPTYHLQRVVRPLPSPNRRFRMRAAAATASTGPVAPDPDTWNEEALASFPGQDLPVVREALAGALTETWAAGALIIREGDPADAFYLVDRGSVDVTKATQPSGPPLATLIAGEWFGEAGLLQQAPRNATVTAGPDGAVLRVLPGDAFLAMVAASDLVASEIGQLLRKRAACARLLAAAPHLAAAAVQPDRLPEFTRRTYRGGQAIVTQGEVAEEFFILLAGQVQVSRRDAAGRTQVVATLGAGDYFGEMGLLHAAPRNATVTVADTGPVETLVTGREGFNRLLAGSGGPRGDLAQAMLARTERLGN
jgi:CRP-like cAMP-binding protein